MDGFTGELAALEREQPRRQTLSIPRNSCYGKAMLARSCLCWGLVCGALNAAPERNDRDGSDLFRGPVPRLRIEIPAEGLGVLRDYNQVWREARPQRIDVRATIREGAQVYTNVAIHLKGSFTFQAIDRKPSLTLNFDKFAPGQRFHGLTKIHLNNSVQDPSYLCEQLARELFIELNVPAPRAGPALVHLNGRDLGVCVLIEGANKQFVKRHFASTEGNLYDGGSGGDVTKALETDAGEHPEDRSDLTNLVKAAREPEPTRRLGRLEQVLDVERFLNFAATEAFLVHWDGYAIGCNNYRLYHDVGRDKMVFIPHGLDQLFGVSSSPSLSLTPRFKGLVAASLLSVPEARQRYLQRIEMLCTNTFRLENLLARVDRLAARLQRALENEAAKTQFEQAVQILRSRIAQRTRSVSLQLKNPKRPVSVPEGGVLALSGWTFKGGPAQPASGKRTVENDREVLCVIGRAPAGSGAWRTTLLLDQGRYEFTGLGRTDAAAASNGTNGMLLRVSGERSTDGLALSSDWRPLRYEFDVRGIEDVEFICELRGEGSAQFQSGSLRLARQGPPSTRLSPITTEAP